MRTVQCETVGFEDGCCARSHIRLALLNEMMRTGGSLGFGAMPCYVGQVVRQLYLPDKIERVYADFAVHLPVEAGFASRTRHTGGSGIHGKHPKCKVAAKCFDGAFGCVRLCE